MSIDRSAFPLQHGQPLQPERGKAKRKGREAAKRKATEREEWIAQGIDPDTGWASGDPNVPPNMERLTGHDLQEAHAAIDARLSAVDEQAAAYGIGEPGDEYLEGRAGLPPDILGRERERMESELASLTRDDVQTLRDEQDEHGEFLDDLWYRYRRDYPEDARDVAAATQAAHAVILRWRSEGRLLVPETADDFALEVSIQQMQGGSGYEHPGYYYEADPPTRTAVFGGGDARDGAGKANDAEQKGPSFTADIREQQKRDGLI